MSLFDIRSAADVRAFAYAMLPTLSSFLVTAGILKADQAALWSALVIAILGPVIAAVHAKTLSSFRVAFYALLAAGQALLIGYGLITDTQDAQVSLWLPVISVILGGTAGGVASANTPTTSPFNKSANGYADPSAPVVD